MKLSIGGWRSRSIGWPEAKREPFLDHGQRDGGPRYLPPDAPIVQQALDQATREAIANVRAQLAASASVPPPQIDRPKVRVRKDPVTGRWCWWLTPFPTTALGHAPSQPAALELGLAALDLATHRAVHSGGKLPA